LKPSWVGWVVGAVLVGVLLAIVWPLDEGAHSRATTPEGAPVSAAGHAPADNIPRPVVRRTTPAVVADPTAESYDPVLLEAVRDATVREIAEAEPRNEAFAGPREQFIRDRLSADLAVHFPDATVADVDCRTSSCIIEVHAPTLQAEAVHDYIQLPPFGAVQNPQLAGEVDPGTARIYLNVLFQPADRDHGAYRAAYWERRREVLATLRDAGELVPEEMP
jgi:hypothetical protein